MPILRPAQSGRSRQSGVSRNLVLILFVITGVAAQFGFFVSRAGAADQNWDGSNTVFDGSTHGGSGTWDNVTTNFTNGAVTANEAWQGGVAIFGTASGTVTLGDNISFQGLTFNIDGYAVVSGSFTLNPTGAASINTVSGVSATISAPVGGAGGLSKGGAGTLVLTGANTYTGDTTITAGTLQLGTVPTSSSIVGAVTNAGFLDIVNADTSGITTITNNSGGSIQFELASTAGVANITNNVGATILFSNTSTAANATIISAGTTAFSETSTAGNATITNNNGGFLQFRISSTAGSATIITNLGGQTLFSNTSTAGTATITTTGGRTEFQDTSSAGTATINTNSGGLTEFFDTSTGSQAKFITAAGGTVDISQLTSGGTTAGSIAGAGAYELGSKTFTVGSDNTDTTVSGTIDDGGLGGGTGGALIKEGTGTLTLTGANTYTGGTTINAGTLQIGDGAANGNIMGDVIDNATLAFNPAGTDTFGGVISGTGGISKLGVGTLILTGTNSYTGGTTISGGVLSVDVDPELGAGGITLDGGELLATASNYITGRGIVLTANNGTIAAEAGNSALFLSTITGVGNLTIGDAVNTGRVEFGGTSTYSGSTTIVSGATLQALSTTALSPNSAFIVNGTLDVSGFDNQIASLSGTGFVINGDTVAATLTVGDITSTLFSGVIEDGSDPIGLTKVGTGTLTLTGANTYTFGTTISGGTLQIGNGGTTGSIAGDVVDNANLAFNRSDNITFSGIISGTGTLTQIGPGTLVLTGANTYTGGTNILRNAKLEAAGNTASLGTGEVRLFGGTLLIDAGVALNNNVNFEPGENGAVNNAGTLAGNINDPNQNGLQEVVSNSGTINGAITLGGSFNAVFNIGTINGNVTLGSGFSGVVLYTGGKINGNLVEAGVNGLSGLYLVGPGQQLLSQAVSGSIVNSGALFKEDPGTWTIDRPLDAPLGTKIQEGTLVLSAALTTPGIEVGTQIGTAATLQFAGSGTINVGSIISGFGNLIQDGTGTTILSGKNTYSGGTVINLGTLLVNNPQALGTGNVTVNGGVLGADPQPINVLGNYTQNAGGTLQLNIAGRNPGQFDVLNVTGTASLNGNLRLLNLGYQPANGDKLQLITAGGVVSGRFSAVQNPFTLAAGFDTIALVYARNAVTLEFLDLNKPVPPAPPGPPVPPAPPIIISITDYASFALTVNQSVIGNALFAVQLAEKDPALVDFLAAEPFANLPGDLEKLSPESLSAIYEISFSAANVQASNLEERFAEIRNGSNGFSSSLNLTNAPGTLVEGKDGKAIIESNKNVLAPSPENKWGVWVSGNGDYVNVSEDGNGHGYDFTTGGVTFGLDYRLTQNLAVGIAGSYAHTWTNLTGSGKIDADGGKAGLYATYFKGGLYLSGYAGGGYNSYSTRREALGGTASGSSDSGEFDGYIGGGYDFHLGAFTVGPIASLQYTYIDVSGNDETGSLAPLRIQSKSRDSLRSNVGLSASYTTKIGKIQVTPSLRASWQHEFLYSALPVSAQFGGGSPEFTVYGPSEGQDSAIINAGVNVQWTPTIGTYFGYNGQLGRDNEDSQGGVCNVHWDF